MSNKILNRVLAYQRCNEQGGSEAMQPSETLVLIVLANHAQDDGFCWPGLDLLAAETKLSVRQVRRVLRKLAERGEVLVRERRGRSRSNHYVVTVGMTVGEIRRTLKKRDWPEPEAQVERLLALGLLVKGKPDTDVRFSGEEKPDMDDRFSEPQKPDIDDRFSEPQKPDMVSKKPDTGVPLTTINHKNLNSKIIKPTCQPSKRGGGMGEGGKSLERATAAGRQAGGQEKSLADHLLRLAGFRTRDRRTLLARLNAGDLTLIDVFSDLARTYADRKVHKPPLATAASLIGGNLPPAEYRDPDVWRQHLPEPVFRAAEQAGIVPSEPTRSSRMDYRDKYLSGPFAEFILTGIEDDEGCESEPQDQEGGTSVWSDTPSDMPVVEGETPAEEVLRWWTNARDQLQREMPKAAFDQWVQPVRLLAYRNGGDTGRFTLSAPDAFTREWLDSRLKRTLERQLAGFARKYVEVEFVA